MKVIIWTVVAAVAWFALGWVLGTHGYHFQKDVDGAHNLACERRVESEVRSESERAGATTLTWVGRANRCLESLENCNDRAGRIKKWNDQLWSDIGCLCEAQGGCSGRRHRDSEWVGRGNSWSNSTEVIYLREARPEWRPWCALDLFPPEHISQRYDSKVTFISGYNP